MNVVEQFDRATSITQNLMDELSRAIALYAMWERCADKKDIIEPLNNTYEARGFMLVRDSVHVNLIMALMRIHDTGKSNISSIANLIRILSDEQLKRHMAHVTAWDIKQIPIVLNFDGTEEQAEELVKDLKAKDAEDAVTRQQQTLQEAIQEYEAFSTNEMLPKLKGLRDKVLAHRDIKIVEHGVKYGYEHKVLIATIPIVHKLCSAILGTDYSFDSIKQNWDKYSDHFWKRLARR